MSIQQLASASGALRLGNILPQARTIGSGDIAVRSCCSQWNECQSDDIYVAIVGPEFDGHDFARDAVQRGASAVVTERLLAIDLPQFIVGDSRLAFGQICHALAGQPSQRLQTTGVSGSNGKTVTSHLIQQIFLAAGADVGLLSTISTATENESKADFSAPGLADRLSTMVLEDCSHAVVEIPSEALAQHTLAGTKLDTAVLTNIHYDDLGFHRTKENYRRANLRLLDYLKPTGVAVLNADDPASHFLLGEIDAPVLTVAMKQQAELTARIVERQAAWQTFLLTAGGQSVAVRTNIIGDQHVYNCLSAAAVGLSNGIELPVIARGLENASTVPGRLERVDCGQPFNVWIDSAKSVRQLATALQSIRKVTKGKVWCVCSTSEEQSRGHRRRIGEITERASHGTVITSSEISNLVDYEPAHQVLDGFNRPSAAEVIPNRFRAIEWALAKAGADDSVLITGCGERPIARVGEQQWTVCDRDVCQAWLYDRAEWGAADSSNPAIFKIDDYR